MVSCFFSKVAVGFICIVILSTNEHQLNCQNFQARKQVFPGFGVFGEIWYKDFSKEDYGSGGHFYAKQNKFTFNTKYSSYLRSNYLGNESPGLLERARCHIV